MLTLDSSPKEFDPSTLLNGKHLEGSRYIFQLLYPDPPHKRSFIIGNDWNDFRYITYTGDHVDCILIFGQGAAEKLNGIFWKFNLRVASFSVETQEASPDT